MRSIGYHPEEREQDEDIIGADLTGANLAGAQLQGTNLSFDQKSKRAAPARGLTAAQLSQANYDDSTSIPDNLSVSLPKH